LCLPLLLLAASVGWVANSFWFYKDGFEKYRISQTTGLSVQTLESIAVDLIDYFNSDAEYASITAIKDGESFELFNQQEVAHLKDVKGLIWLDYRLFLGALIYVLAYTGVSLFRWRDRRQLARGVAKGSIITLGILVVLGIMSTLVDFGTAFTRFHFLAFTNELWRLDPAKDYMIMLFPEGFWYDATLLCGGMMAGLAVILGGASGVYLKRAGKRAKA